MAKISVIVPIYKVEEFLPRCLDSMLNQTLRDLEIVLVDDGSPDGCPAMCDRYSEQDGRVRVIHKPNGGVSAARNDGLKAATGDYVVFCDSDDWLVETGLETLYEKAVESGADVTIGDVFLSNGDGDKRVRFYDRSFVTDDGALISELLKADIYRTYCPNPPAEGPAFGYGGPWNKLVRRDFLLKHDIIFDVRLKGIFDDILYSAYLLANAQRVAYVQAPVYHYRIVEGSLTHAFRPNVVDVNRAIFGAWEELFRTLINPEQYRKAFDACVLRRTEEAITTYFGNEQNSAPRAELKREFAALMAEEPYRSAVRGADFAKVSKKQKAIALLCRLHMAGLALAIV